MAIKRVYGKEKTIGDILYNKESKSVFFNIELGVFGRKTVYLTKNNEGTYDLHTTYVKDGESHVVRLGKTFVVENKEGQKIDGMSKGSLGLTTAYDKELGKNITTRNDAIYFTVHKLKEDKVINDKLVKVGWVTGQIGVEVESEEGEQPQKETKPKKETKKVAKEETPDVPEVDIDDGDIPF